MKKQNKKQKLPKAAKAPKLYKIESGIKLPELTPKVGNGPSVIFQTMTQLKKGQSFLVKDIVEAMRAEKVVKDANTRGRKKENGSRFAVRKLSNGIRIWRTE